MNCYDPIYTEKTECQDCYKCVRACPVKAIKVIDNSASIIPETCIRCGTCTEVCPVGAKKIRDDLQIVQEMVSDGKRVVISLAPSYRTEFEGISAARLIAAIKTLGIWGVSETALGAEQVSAACSELILSNSEKIMISSCCPVIVNLIKHYYPEHINKLTGLLSPLQAHAKLLRNVYGKECEIVFVGPCIAKKDELDNNLSAVLTFKDLRRWFIQANVKWSFLDEKEEFIPYAASEGMLYPIDAGMHYGIRKNNEHPEVQFMTFSGINSFITAIEEISDYVPNYKIFIEALACPGGCVNGPVITKPGATIRKHSLIKNSFEKSPKKGKPPEKLDIGNRYTPEPIAIMTPTDREIGNALRLIGKKKKSDELNCGGCGYDTCREFANALLAEKAEPKMCVSYLRKLTMNKAAALLKAMPSGVVIVDNDLKIIECNKRFVDLIGGDADVVSEVNPDLEGAYLERLIPFHSMFRGVLDEGVDVYIQDVEHFGKIIRLTLFTVEPHRIVGGVLQDITKPVIQREQIIEQTNKIMKKNLTTVQQIAFLLGENAAESEILLNSIIESFSRKE